jgi:hypothetical protein
MRVWFRDAGALLLGLVLLTQSADAVETLVINAPSSSAVERIERALSTASPSLLRDTVKDLLVPLRRRRSELARSASELAKRPEFSGRSLGPAEELAARALVARHNERVTQFRAESTRLLALAESLGAHKATLAKSQAAALFASAEARIKEIEWARNRELAQIREVLSRAPGVSQALHEWAAIPLAAREQAIAKADAAAMAVFSHVAFHKIDVHYAESAASTQAELKALESRYFASNPEPEVKAAYLELLAELHSEQGLQHFFRGAAKVPTFYSLSSNLVKNHVAQAALDALQVIARDPRVDLLRADTELWLAVGYARFAGYQANLAVDSLSRLAETELKTHANYSKMFVTHTRELSELKSQQRRLREALKAAS